MHKDEIKGKFEKAKGAAKEKLGRVTNDPEMEGEGTADRAKGEIREGIGKAKEKIRDAADEMTE